MSATLVRKSGALAGGNGRVLLGVDDYFVHPLVSNFPEWSDQEVGREADRIKQAEEPPVFLTFNKDFIDSFGRFKACQIARVKPIFREFGSFDSLAEQIAILNMPRINLEASQRAALAVPIVDEISKETTEKRRSKLKAGEKNPNRTQSARSCKFAGGSDEGEATVKASAIFHVSPRYIYQAKAVRAASPEVFDRLRLGTVNLNQARLQIDKQKRSVELLTPTAAKAVDRKDAKIIVGDCLVEMEKITAPIADLIFADPPYNNGTHYDADPSRDKREPVSYLGWCDAWMHQCDRLLKPSGSIFVMIDAVHCGAFDAHLRSHFAHWRNLIVWHDTFPNHTDQNFQPAARFIHYFTKDKKRFTWNAHAVREPSARDIIGDKRRVHEKGIVPQNVWRYHRVTNSEEAVPYADAPPQIHHAILERIILACSNPGDTVFDPFAGNGTTGRSAIKLGRKFVGIERSPLYAEQARKWIAKGIVSRKGAEDGEHAEVDS